MAIFRSKPFEIEATQLTVDYARDLAKAGGATPAGLLLVLADDSDDVVRAYCTTRQGRVEAAVGDWIIPESDGSGCYPCKPDVFALKYERVL